jgi:ubiquinone/menaquinone biosynthesis C-methylase UbiE
VAHHDSMGTDPSTDATAGQLSRSAADVYEEFFVPALFGQWAEKMLDALGAVDGARLLDVGSGTGVVARAAVPRVGARGSVVAVDPNEAMVAVAKRMCPDVDVRIGTAEHLPVGSDEIDCATCQFALMYFSDRARAIREIARVLRPGGRVAIATWAAVEETPGYAAMVDLLSDEIGEWAAEATRAPFCIGTPEQLGDLLRPSFPKVTVQRHGGQACFASLDDWMHTEIRGWTLAEHIDDEQFARLCRRASTVLSRFVGDDGRVRFPATALIATATAGR